MAEHYQQVPRLVAGERIGFTLPDGELRYEIIKAVHENKDTGEVTLEFE